MRWVAMILALAFAILVLLAFAGFGVAIVRWIASGQCL